MTCVYTIAFGRGEKKNSKPPLAPLLPFWEKGLGDEGGFSICVR
jgi:hypothetical protein